MICVAHRRNTLDQLAQTPTHLGVEVDVRWRDGRLIVAHDPGDDGPDWDVWLSGYRHALLVVNTKEEGIVERALAAVDRVGVADAFVLGPDPGEALPLWRRGERRIAVRCSELHPPAMALGLARWLRWVWVDGFDDWPLETADVEALKAAKLRLCGVSPELYGRSEAEIPGWKARVAASGGVHAWCTRRW